MAIEMRLFGRTGMRVSNLCLDAMMFGARTEPADSYPYAMGVAHRIWINAIIPLGHHVAPFYEADFGPHRHRV